MFPTLFTEQYYGGDSLQLSLGYNAGPLPKVGNEGVSSICVPNGFRVTLFEKNWRNGRELELTTSVPKLGLFNFDNIVFNVFVERVCEMIDISSLTGRRPALLEMMASTSATPRTLKGDDPVLEKVVAETHAHAIGQYRDIFYIALDALMSDKANIWVYDTSTESSTTLSLPPGYLHPSSIQIAQDYMIVTLDAFHSKIESEDKTKNNCKSKILIFSLAADPNSPQLIASLEQPSVNCCGAGLAFHPGLQRWFILADQNGPDDIMKRTVLYRSVDDSVTTWEPEPIEKYTRWGSGKGINLVTATDKSIWGLFYDNREVVSDLAAWDMDQDRVRLFRVVGDDGVPLRRLNPTTQIINNGMPRNRILGELLSNRPCMRFGATLRNESGTLELLTCQRNVNKNFKIACKTLVYGKADALLVDL